MNPLSDLEQVGPLNTAGQGEKTFHALGKSITTLLCQLKKIIIIADTLLLFPVLLWDKGPF